MVPIRILRRLFLQGLLLLPAAVSAKVYHMAVDGKDNQPGTLTQPFATANPFVALAQPGDTLLIRGGVYLNQETLIKCSGSPGKFITFKNYPGEVPVFDGGGSGKSNAFYADDGTWAKNGTRYIRIQGLFIRNYFRGGIHLGFNYKDKSKTISNYDVRYNVVDMCGQNGITAAFGDSITIEYNVVSRTGWNAATGSWSSNINLYNLVGSSNTVGGNISFHAVDVSAHKTDGNGMILDMFQGPTSSGATVENNVIFENGGAGIAWTRCDNAWIRNNTLYENGRHPQYVYTGTGMVFYREPSQGAFKNIHLLNNIVIQKSGKGLYRSADFTTGTRSHNLISGTTAYAYPQLVDTSKADFRLGVQSPARGSGTADDSPDHGLAFDSRVLIAQTENQPISWYRWAPNLDYIISRGGLENILKRPSRMGKAVDQGALVTDGSTPPAPTPGAENLVQIPGFDAAGSWTYASNARRTATVKHSGSHALEISGNAIWGNTHQTFSVKPGKTYRFRFLARGNFPIQQKIQTTGWNKISEARHSLTSEWKEYGMTFQSGSHDQVMIVIQDAGAGMAYVDEVEVVELPASTAMILRRESVLAGTAGTWRSVGRYGLPEGRGFRDLVGRKGQRSGEP